MCFSFNVAFFYYVQMHLRLLILIRAAQQLTKLNETMSQTMSQQLTKLHETMSEQLAKLNETMLQQLAKLTITERRLDTAAGLSFLVLNKVILSQVCTVIVVVVDVVCCCCVSFLSALSFLRSGCFQASQHLPVGVRRLPRRV
jgi:Flp pilus assembly protein TadB